MSNKLNYIKLTFDTLEYIVFLYRSTNAIATQIIKKFGGVNVMNHNIVITISRQYGAGGGELGQLLSKRLGIPLYNRDVLAKTAQLYQLNENVLRAADEIPGKKIEGLLVDSMSTNERKVFDAETVFDVNTIFSIQKDTIQKLADQGGCIIVGRLANYALKDFRNKISLYIYADKEYRIHRMMKKEHSSYLQTRQLLEQVDRERKRYCKYYSGKEWGSYANYDYVFNSQKLEISDIADIVTNLYGKEDDYE